MRVYIKALTETSVTSPYSPPAPPESSPCSSMSKIKSAQLLILLMLIGGYMILRVWEALGKFTESRAFSSSSYNWLQCRSNEYWFIPVLSSIDPYVPFHSCHPRLLPWSPENNKYSVVLKRTKCCLTLIVLLFTTTSSVGLRIYWWWSCGSWVGLMTVQLRSQMASHYSILNVTLQAELSWIKFSSFLSLPIFSYSLRWARVNNAFMIISQHEYRNRCPSII